MCTGISQNNVWHIWIPCLPSWHKINHHTYSAILIHPAVDLYVFILYPMPLLNSFHSRRIFVRFLGIIYVGNDLSCVQMGAILFFPFHCVCLSFLFLAFLQWLEVLVICWIRVVRFDILALPPILEGSIHFFFTIQYYVSCRYLFCWYPVSNWSSFPLFHMLTVLLRMAVWFSINMVIWFFFFSLLIMADYIDFFQSWINLTFHE